MFRDNYPAEYDSMIIMLLTHTKQVLLSTICCIIQILTTGYMGLI